MAFNSQYAQTLHRHTVMWLDENVGVPGNNQTMKDRFRRVTYPLHTFTQVQPAIDFIRQQQIDNISVFLIVSGRLALQIVPQVYHLACVTQIFLFCGQMSKYTVWATDYIEKLMMFDSDEELLIRVTNDIAKYLTEEANRYDGQGRTEYAAGLLDWADWLYNDADTLQRAVCQQIRQNIRQRRQKLNIDHQIAHPNQFNN